MKETEMVPVAPPDDAEVTEYPRYWLPDRVYKVLKWVCIVGVPAVGVGYQALSGIWGFPYANEVPQTLCVAALVIGCLIGVSEIKGMGGGSGARAS